MLPKPQQVGSFQLGKEVQTYATRNPGDYHHVGWLCPRYGDRLGLFIGHATVLIRYAGFTMLTDPIFIHMHEQVPLGYGLHTTRLTNPAIDIGELLALVQLAVGQAPGTRDKT